MIKIARVTVFLLLLITAHGHANNALAQDVRFSSGNSALKIPFELYNNHIYLQVSVNGSKPLRFILDTGSSHIIDTKQAKALGLKLQFQGQAQGIGEGKVDFHSSTGMSGAGAGEGGPPTSR